jgi:hypothetical protein
MAGPELAVKDRLVSIPTTAEDRIYPLRMPQKDTTFPLIVYSRISSPRVYTQEGDSLLIEPRIQLNLWTRTYEDMDVLSLQVKGALTGWRDDSVGVQHCFLMFELDEWEEVTGLYRKMIDAQVGYKGVA